MFVAEVAETSLRDPERLLVHEIQMKENDQQDYLRRLPPSEYRGERWIHWVLTMQDRCTGWLDARFYYRFREALTHVAFRDQLACPIFCLMPDHIHLLWCGLTSSVDQRSAMKRFRRDLNACLRRIGFELQRQAYDHVLREEEVERTAVEDLSEYIARNPERKNLVAMDGFRSYPFTSCLLPGFPELSLFADDGWESIWRTLSYLRRTQCFRVSDPKREQS